MNHPSKVNRPGEVHSEDATSALVGGTDALNSGHAFSKADLLAWLPRNLPSWTAELRSEVAMAILDDLPTPAIVGIVKQLKTRITTSQPKETAAHSSTDATTDKTNRVPPPCPDRDVEVEPVRRSGLRPRPARTSRANLASRKSRRSEPRSEPRPPQSGPGSRLRRK